MTEGNTQNVEMSAEERLAWLEVRKKAGLEIDPQTAEVMWDYRLTGDPYGIFHDIPDELQQVGREYFARAPGSDVWVAFQDLPETTSTILWEKHKSVLAFPAGLAERLAERPELLALLREFRIEG